MATVAAEENVWGGGNRPFGASYGKLMMWFFLVSDALTFSGFLTAYGLMRFKFIETWPIAENVFTHFPFVEGDQPLLYVALMTFILIMSSVTMVLAVHEDPRPKCPMIPASLAESSYLFKNSSAPENATWLMYFSTSSEDIPKP